MKYYTVNDELVKICEAVLESRQPPTPKPYAGGAIKPGDVYRMGIPIPRVGGMGDFKSSVVEVQMIQGQTVIYKRYTGSSDYYESERANLSTFKKSLQTKSWFEEENLHEAARTPYMIKYDIRYLSDELNEYPASFRKTAIDFAKKHRLKHDQVGVANDGSIEYNLFKKLRNELKQNKVPFVEWSDWPNSWKWDALLIALPGLKEDLNEAEVGDPLKEEIVVPSYILSTLKTLGFKPAEPGPKTYRILSGPNKIEALYGIPMRAGYWADVFFAILDNEKVPYCVVDADGRYCYKDSREAMKALKKSMTTIKEDAYTKYSDFAKQHKKIYPSHSEAQTKSAWENYKKMTYTDRARLTAKNARTIEADSWRKVFSNLRKEDLQESSWDIGQKVKVVGPVEHKGKSGKIVDIGRDAKFIVVEIPGKGKISFHASDLK